MDNICKNTSKINYFIICKTSFLYTKLSSFLYTKLCLLYTKPLFLMNQKNRHISSKIHFEMQRRYKIKRIGSFVYYIIFYTKLSIYLSIYLICRGVFR